MNKTDNQKLLKRERNQIFSELENIGKNEKNNSTKKLAGRTKKRQEYIKLYEAVRKINKQYVTHSKDHTLYIKRNIKYTQNIEKQQII